jgi:hypothetical protein
VIVDSGVLHRAYKRPSNRGSWGEPKTLREKRDRFPKARSDEKRHCLDLAAAAAASAPHQHLYTESWRPWRRLLRRLRSKVADAGRCSTELTGTRPPRRIRRHPWWVALGRSPLRAIAADRDSPTSINGWRPLRAPPQDRSTGALSTSGERALWRRASWATSLALATIALSLSLSLSLSCSVAGGWGANELGFTRGAVECHFDPPKSTHNHPIQMDG